MIDPAVLPLDASQWKGTKGRYSYVIMECTEDGFTVGVSLDQMSVGLGHADTFWDAQQKILDIIAKNDAAHPPPDTIGPWVRCVLEKAETWSTGVESFNVKVKKVLIDKWSWVATDTSSGGWGEDEDSISGMCTSRDKAFKQSLKVVNAIIEAKR